MISPDKVDASIALHKKTKLEHKLNRALLGIRDSMLSKLEKSLLGGAVSLALYDVRPYIKVITLNHYKDCMNEFKRNIRGRSKSKSYEQPLSDESLTDEGDSAIDDAIALALLPWFLKRSQTASEAIFSSMTTKVEHSFDVAEKLRREAILGAYSVSRLLSVISESSKEVSNLSSSVSGIDTLAPLKKELSVIQQELNAVSLAINKTSSMHDVFDFSQASGMASKIDIAKEQVETALEAIDSIKTSEDLSLMMTMFASIALAFRSLSKAAESASKKLNKAALEASSTNAINDPKVIRVAILSAAKSIETSLAIAAALETQIASERVKITEAKQLAKTEEIKKKWVTVGDDRVRDTHEAVNNTVRGLEEFFLVGKSLMLYPSDMDNGADLSEVINCRCSAYYFKE